MDKILYYPYINLPKTDWTIRTLLYYDSVSSIVPQEYFYSPERNYEPFMLELVKNELVIPIDPIQTLEYPWGIAKPFLEFIQSPYFKLNEKRNNFLNGSESRIHIEKFSGVRIHSDKFNNEIFYSLENLGLARRQNESWYMVEKTTANYLMKYLATIISTKLEMRPTTDNFYNRTTKISQNIQNRKRETILTNLIPFPEDIDLKKLLNFKEKHNDILKSFKNKVEQIVLDEKLIEGTELFNTKIQELILEKDELSIRMNESQFKKIMFGSVCGIIGATTSFVTTANTASAIVGAIPGFVSAIYSGLQMERAENLFDQSGMKYLALVDKRIRGKQ